LYSQYSLHVTVRCIRRVLVQYSAAVIQYIATTLRDFDTTAVVKIGLSTNNANKLYFSELKRKHAQSDRHAQSPTDFNLLAYGGIIDKVW